MNWIVITVLVIITITIGLIILKKYKYYNLEEKRILSLFQPGKIIDYYEITGHGKFTKETVLVSYEIIDTDGNYALGKNTKTGKETELNLWIDMRYSDKMVLREKDGTIIKIFKFE